MARIDVDLEELRNRSDVQFQLNAVASLRYIPIILEYNHAVQFALVCLYTLNCRAQLLCDASECN